MLHSQGSVHHDREVAIIGQAGTVTPSVHSSRVRFLSYHRLPLVNPSGKLPNNIPPVEGANAEAAPRRQAETAAESFMVETEMCGNSQF